MEMGVQGTGDEHQGTFLGGGEADGNGLELDSGHGSPTLQKH